MFTRSISFGGVLILILIYPLHNNDSTDNCSSSCLFAVSMLFKPSEDVRLDSLKLLTRYV